MNEVPSKDHRMKHMTMFPANWLTLGDDMESVCFIRISGRHSSRSQQRSSYDASGPVTTNAARIRMRHLMIVESLSSSFPRRSIRMRHTTVPLERQLRFCMRGRPPPVNDRRMTHTRSLLVLARYRSIRMSHPMTGLRVGLDSGRPQSIRMSHPDRSRLSRPGFVCHIG